MKELIYLASKEFRLEWRQKSVIAGIIIYVVSTIFICYITFRQIIDIPTWNALFWIIMLFAAINAVARSFMQESRGLQIYYYTLVNPVTVILSKIVYNAILLTGIAIINYLVYSLFLGNEVTNHLMFFIGLILGSIGLASTLTMISAIAARANGTPSLMAILSFPVMIPLILTIIRFSKNAIDGIAWTVNSTYALVLLALIGMVITLSYLLFPYLWRE